MARLVDLVRKCADRYLSKGLCAVKRGRSWENEPKSGSDRSRPHMTPVGRCCVGAQTLVGGGGVEPGELKPWALITPALRTAPNPT